MIGWSESGADLLDVLALEPIEQNLYRANLVFAQEHALYGGQVAAQALRAAGLTVDPERHVHSLHGYFLRKGDSQIPTVYQVFRDRDGRSFSARRVVAIQRGAVIFNMSASFHVRQDGWASQTEPMPAAEPPVGLPASDLHRLFSMEGRIPTQPFADRTPLPTRFWARATVPLGDDPLVHACALAYLSDILTGVLPAEDGSARPGPSLDHAVWFHGAVDLNDWTLSDYHPRVSGHGRGWYTGSIFNSGGTLVASIAQETLFR
ncbi:MAG TPA: acyl-CoA thioesterase domain-containing protein [Streptosporangiaceae bacterium]|nr:acyl-CoA thioesterase domain-containing protein [Streptosporangiaceae bacterium]